VEYPPFWGLFTGSDVIKHHVTLIIEGAPHENKMAEKGQITSERVSS
jgi:hypothetical protein